MRIVKLPSSICTTTESLYNTSRDRRPDRKKRVKNVGNQEKSFLKTHPRPHREVLVWKEEELEQEDACDREGKIVAKLFNKKKISYMPAWQVIDYQSR